MIEPRVGDSRMAETRRTWIVGHVWIREGDWVLASETERTGLLVMAARTLMVHAPGSGPGPWLEWHAVPHPSGKIAIVLEFAGRAW